MVPDYYSMLGVDPGADRAALEAALARSQPAWSSGTRNPKTKHTYQSYLDQIPALRQALLGDPSARAAFDAELAAARRAERDARLDSLQKKIRLRAAKGGLTVSDRKLLRDEAAKLGLTAEDLDRLAETIPPRPESPLDDDPADPPADVLDPVMRRQLGVALEHLRKRDLYDALGVERDAPAREIALRADAERQRWMKKTQVTAEKTAWLEVVTLAQSHLSTPTARARYDRTLDLEAEEVLSESIKFALMGLPRLDPGTRALLLDEAAEFGVAPDRAERLIARACRTIGVVRDPGAAAPLVSTSFDGPLRLLRCRSCAGVTEYGQVSRAATRASCRHCGASLHWICPVCQRTHWVDKPRCPCGLRVELREPLVRHFEAAQQAFRVRDYVAALGHLKWVQELAPKHVGARKGVEKIKERVGQIDVAHAAFEVARAGGRLVAAKKAAEELGRLVDPAASDWRAAYTDVTRALRDAHSLVSRARELKRTDPRKARDLYRRSHAIAADLDEALAGLKRCPPDPPSDLTASFVDDRVRLRWAPPPPDDLGPVTFVILRKPEAAFTHPADGVRIGESSAAEFEDAGVTAGTSVAYAIVSKRGEIESVGAVAVGPMFLMGEVRAVRVETRSREVDLSWTPPRGASEVRVVRKRGTPPAGPQDGDRVEAMIDQAHDRGLEPDRVYHYGIFAVYRMADGRATASRGVFIAAQPHAPVHPLEAPTLTPEPDGRVTIRWVEPARGIVKVLRTTQPLPHSAGARLAPIQVASLEGDWVEVDAPDHAIDTPPATGSCYYTPLTAWGGTATVGHPASYSCVTDPSDLRASRAGVGQVHLRWRWSPHGNQSLVVFKSGSPPTGPDDPSAHVETVHEVDYGRQGRHTLMLPTSAPGPWHVAVYALSMADGQPVTSPGTEPTARTVVPGPNPEVTVSYAFRRGRLTGRKASVTFRTEPPGSPIPPTVLVTHSRTVPLSADDGTLVAEFPASQDGATFPLPSGVNLSRSRARIFADPRAEPDGLPPIRLRHPEAGATRV
jgi:hypothetical protein